MKKLLFISTLCFLLASCGQSKKEEERQRQIEDSLHNLEMEDVLDNVNDYFETDSLSAVKNENE